ncbi:hypothetical protein TWF788_004194 [Orbilia oligospora]|uniref:Uncharacterized protein n=1 Tax=Orbilia oligospora TaxID=2813651 RepID=A0A7C8Q3N2_ORBOL|nr:hypothetical protein TWF788_004194 [Orbilia oligospora]
MHFPISAATAAAIFTILIDQAAAHCRFVHTTGDKGGDGRGLLSTWTHHGNNDVWGQKEATIFSDPPVPNPAFTRLWLNEGCGVTLQTVDLWWVMFGGRGTEDWWKYQQILTWQPKITKEAWVQTWWETKKQADAGTMAVVSGGGSGWLHMAVLQINEDGAGPFRCRVDPHGDGKYPWGWEPNDRYMNMPEPNDGGAAKSFWPHGKHKAHLLKWKVPRGMYCAGKSGQYSNVCIMRCENFATNGPFGGCIPFRVVDLPPENKPAPEAEKPIVKPVEKPEVVDYGYHPQPAKANDGGYYKRSVEAVDPNKIKVRRDDEGILPHVVLEKRTAEALTETQIKEQKRSEERAMRDFARVKRSVENAVRRARRSPVVEPPHVMNQEEN